MKLEANILLYAMATVALAAVLACPIQRSPVPREYLPFRAGLQDAVTDTALVEMEGLPRMQSRLDSQLTDLAAILTVDSLLAALEADRELAPLAGAIATTVRIQLESKSVDGGVRKAFRNPDGQRQAVDAIVIGLGKALYRVRSPRDALLEDKRCRCATARASSLAGAPQPPPATVKHTLSKAV